jgi:hypothetical protein
MNRQGRKDCQGSFESAKGFLGVVTNSLAFVAHLAVNKGVIK